MSAYKEITVSDEHPLLNREGMFYKEFPSDYRQIRYFTLLIVQKAPAEIKEINLLEQQISEIIKNAVKHGNKCDKNKKIKVWFYFSNDEARIIVEDEGEGFAKIHEWNDFHRNRQECLRNDDYERLANYVAYTTEESDDNDGGNALFAAVEYWNEGVVYTNKANCIGVGRKTVAKGQGLEIS
ncbi:MAG: ATP-binding protein [Spirochaetales bacterium]|nr:ATP-binding protein [Spirochaetales bacterium]